MRPSVVKLLPLLYLLAGGWSQRVSAFLQTLRPVASARAVTVTLVMFRKDRTMTLAFHDPGQAPVLSLRISRFANCHPEEAAELEQVNSGGCLAASSALRTLWQAACSPPCRWDFD